MKKALFLFFMVCSLFSCTSIISYQVNTEALEVLSSGNIVTNNYDETVNISDICINGKTLYTWDASILYLDFLYPNKVDIKKWVGKTYYGEACNDIEISYRLYKGEYGIRKIEFIQFAGHLPIYKFNKFKVDDTYVLEDKMPVEITRFSIGNKKYTLLATVMKTVQATPNGIDTYLGLMKNPEQVFSITDEDGAVCAEFTKDYYKIFGTESEIDTKLLWSCIAAFSIIQDICVTY